MSGASGRPFFTSWANEGDFEEEGIAAVTLWRMSSKQCVGKRTKMSKDNGKPSW